MNQDQALQQLKEQFPSTFKKAEASGSRDAYKTIYNTFAPRYVPNAPEWSDNVSSKFLQDFAARDDNSEPPGYFDSLLTNVMPDVVKAGLNDSMVGYAYNILMDDDLIDKSHISQEFNKRLQEGDVDFMDKVMMGTTGLVADIVASLPAMALGTQAAVGGATALGLNAVKGLTKEAAEHVSKKFVKKF